MEFIPAKQILSSWMDNENWFGTNYNMNIYKGCCHGCIYCDSRSQCYRIDNFDTVRGKSDALEILNREFRSKRRTGVVATGSMSDPYNPFEAEYKLTRGALELIDRYNFGVAIATKSTLVTRDIDILKKIKKHSPVIIKITITCADDTLSRIIEPKVFPSSERYQALRGLNENGIFAGILMMPILPFINDNADNILNIISQARDSGARFIYPAFGVTLRQNQREYFLNKAEKHFKGISQKYIKEYGMAYGCSSKRSEELWQLFKAECDKSKILYKMEDIIMNYKKGNEENQISMF